MARHAGLDTVHNQLCLPSTVVLTLACTLQVLALGEYT